LHGVKLLREAIIKNLRTLLKGDRIAIILRLKECDINNNNPLQKEILEGNCDSSTGILKRERIYSLPKAEKRFDVDKHARGEICCPSGA
jgi:hypothetical protein